MNIEDIDRFFKRKDLKPDEFVKITFKQREAMFGLFITDKDYADLRAKNFWRIVPQSKIEAYKTSKNTDLARLFNGAEFSKLSTYRESFE